jgi:1-acyl-sn-glycerol-3-phosphate acyltransferase
MLPPRPVRRLLLAPLAIAATVTLAVLFAPLAVIAALAGLAGRSRPRRMRALRLLWFTLAWLVAETLTLLHCLGLWILSGFGARLRTGRYEDRHYAVMQRFLGLIARAGRFAAGVRIEVDGPALTAEEQAALGDGPVIVLSRHAGPGDTLLLVHHLLAVYGRRPRVVLKAALQLDPGVDVLANRLPNVFVSQDQTGGGIFAEQIQDLGRGLGSRGALVIFPEGGNWTPGRRRRGIQGLERRGHRNLAARAREMPNLLPPRPGGVIAAITACPDADVIFVAHAGLDRLVSAGDVWRSLPVHHPVRARWWRVPADQVPSDADREVQVRWLYDWWRQIDQWITRNRPDPENVLPAA